MVVSIVHVRLLVCLHGDENVCSVRQEKEKGKNIVVVGSWNAKEHIDWAKKNVARSYQLKDDGVQKVK